MNTAKLSLVSLLLAGIVIGGAGCASMPEGSGGAASAPSGLRSQRRLVYRLAGPVVIAQAQPSGLLPGLDRELRGDVRRDMRELGLEVDADPSVGHDLTVHLSASVQVVGSLARARASLWLMADGQLLEQIGTDDVIEAPDRLAGALSRDLVERLVRSSCTARYADAIYGRRLRPLRDTVGRHSAGRGDEGGVPPIEALAHAERRRDYVRASVGRDQLLPPAPPPEATVVSARAAAQQAQTLLAEGQAREAYAAFERAYVTGGEAEPLYGMAESLLQAGAKQQAVIFYRAYLRRAEPSSPEALRANAQVSTLEPAAAPRP